MGNQKVSLWRQMFAMMGYQLVWLSLFLYICIDIVDTAVTSSDLPPSALVSIIPSPSALDSSLIPQQLSTLVSMETPVVNSTSIPNPSSSLNSQILQTLSQQISMQSTQTVLILPTPSSTILNIKSAEISEQASSMLSIIPMSTLIEPSASIHPSMTFLSSSSSQYLIQTSIGISELASSISPTASTLLPSVLMSSERNQIGSSIPFYTPEMSITSTLNPDITSATIEPSPSLGSTSVTMASSFQPSTSPVPVTPSSSSAYPESSIMPSRVIPSTTMQDLSSLLSSSSVVLQPMPTSEVPTSSIVLQPTPTLEVPTSSIVLQPTPTLEVPTSESTSASPTLPGPSSRPPTTQLSRGGPLTMAQWIGVAVAATLVAVLLLCIVIWWLLRGGKSSSKHKPHYTIDNVRIDYSRSTSTDPRDVWRNSLLLESMSARIVVPDENDDELMQAKPSPNPGYRSFDNEGFEDETDQANTSSESKEVPLTKL